MKRVNILALSAVVISLIACTKKSPANKFDELYEFEWTTKMIQVEARYDEWYARDPLPLNMQMRVQSDIVDRPDYQVVFEPVENAQYGFVLNRKIIMTCDGETIISHILNMYDIQYGWSATATCHGRDWRMSIADTNTVLRPPVADSNEFALELRKNAS